jgi:hypothetical protein
MSGDELDRILAREDDLTPSSGFVSSVMDAVRRDAATPPAIPFPWTRAVPGFAAWVVTLAAVAASAFGWIEDPSGEDTALAIARLVEAAASIGGGWIVLGLLLSLVSVKLSIRLRRAAPQR